MPRPQGPPPYEALTLRINDAQQANALTRTEWQILNVLRDAGEATAMEKLATTLRTFANPLDALTMQQL